ncbi:TIGR03668 family PPOX class F420-dependent oxidoreductase [Saccharopolyspora sp. HNM0983]|uniref:TIGR03668 family PPOX class F420-dependent oxidoreductase n=1 Tax=Saccharopolyspora montiporae TaxID=2781240 RepID=A0A929BBE9_9PSEU|nr:TIGR03668 family PPOX class F420-dependent oxidoreductase [Saccharopolyspora sp. HNM0983]MBE9374936.1 TIGR03668 family PPOX class F420-dependent oxidoreductase [Saccharopolyspora sp. HNM0983]
MRITRAQARDRFARGRVARMASADAGGRPHLVPVVFAVVEDVIVTAVDHKPKSTARLKRLDNIAANPAVSLLVDHYAEDWNLLWWVRVDGSARVGTAAEHPELVDALVAKYEQYRQQRPRAGLIVIEPASWSGWSAS